MFKNVSPTAPVVDLAAHRGRRHAENAAETTGRLLQMQLYTEADADLGVTEPTPSRTLEEWAIIVHGVVGDEVDDVTFGRLVDAIAGISA
ncbi:hypothetical protein [Geodermatophilus sp. URMC 62]|uniref:hypothetical protein n=1 Tax=Geodermatophilus sp. URMC 62 TaxID=3423414 RepID=UPI00406C9765